MRFQPGSYSGLSPGAKNVREELALRSRIAARALQEAEALMETPNRNAKQHGNTESASSSGEQMWTPEVVGRMLGELTLSVKNVKESTEGLAVGIQILMKDKEDAAVERQSMWTVIQKLNTAVVNLNEILSNSEPVSRPAPSMAGSTGMFSKSDRADDGAFNSTTLCVFEVEYPANVDGAEKMGEVIAKRIGGAAGIPSDRIRVTPIQDAYDKEVPGVGVNVVKTITLQHFRMHFVDSETAFKVLRQKTAIHDKVGLWVNEDLTPEQQRVRKERLPVYKELREKSGWWVQWRGADIYVNTTFKLDHTRVNKSNGKPLLVKRGFWYKFADYPVPVNEVGGDSAMDDGADVKGAGEETRDVRGTDHQADKSAHTTEASNQGSSQAFRGDGSRLNAQDGGAVRTPDPRQQAVGVSKPARASEQLKSGGVRDGQTGGLGRNGKE